MEGPEGSREFQSRSAPEQDLSMHETYDVEFPRQAATDQVRVRLGIIGGGQLARMTALAALPLGCAFADRCRWVQDACLSQAPEVTWLAPNHSLRCLRAADTAH